MLIEINFDLKHNWGGAKLHKVFRQIESELWFSWQQIVPRGLECGKSFYYIPITDTTLEQSVFCPSDTESRINELRFSESISLSFKTKLTSVTCVCGDVT